MSDLLRITERYRLDKLIHASDTASVFRAADLRSGETVALKLIRGDIDESRHDVRSQFDLAMQALGDCRHASIPRLIDHGFTAAGSGFLVTEYLPGAGFELLAGSPVGRVLPLLLPVLDGLEELGRHQLAHRNLRADNLLLVPRGDDERLVLLGWGSAAAGAGEEGCRADLRDFAAATCAAIGAEIQRQPALEVILPPSAAGDPIADAPELAMLLSLLLQPGTSAPASLYAELRRAFHQALLGQPEPVAGGTRQGGNGAAAARELPETPETPDVVDLDQTRAVAADVTIAVPRDRLLGAMDRWSAAGAAGGGGADEPACGPELRLIAAAAPQASPAGEVRGDTLPAFRPEDLGGGSAGEATAPVTPFQPAQRRSAAPVRLLRPISPLPGGAAAGRPGPLAGPALDAAAMTGEVGEPGPTSASPTVGAAARPGRRVPAAAAIVLVGVAALVLTIAALAFLRRPAARPHAATAAERRSAAAGAAATAFPRRTAAKAPPPVAAAARDPHLQAVDDLLAAGDAAGARRELAQISAAQLAALATAERADYDRLAAALAADRRRQITADLAAALRRGDIRRINAALTAAKWEPDLPAAVRRDLDRARQAIDLDTRLGRTDVGQAPQDVLRGATDLLALLPRYSRASMLREQAAKTIEDQADAALAAGDGERAAGLLGGLRQAWPDRPGLQDRFERIEGQRRADAQLDAVLAAAGRAEAAAQPLQGLELLAGANPGGRYRERFRRERERLEAMLARLDAAPPAIALAPGFRLEYDKGAHVVVPLRISDDLAVKSAECWVRTEGAAAYRAVPVRHLSGADYAVDIPPELHQNRTLELYAAASDHSGHQSLLGSRDQPLKLKRRNWIEKIFSGKEGERPGAGGGGHGGAGGASRD
ncbi:MAG TPA: hypothetical protein VOA80_25205 [Thermoanaerobaculia bacterium]|nr:hypothetical protein [Thermoanaerobaculia bacterium]